MSADPDDKHVNMTIWTPKSLHRRIKVEAARRDMSMTKFVLMCVRKEMDRTLTTDKEHQ